MSRTSIVLAALAMPVWSILSRLVSGLIPGMRRAQGVFSLLTSLFLGLFVVYTTTSLPTNNAKAQRTLMLKALAAGAAAGVIAFATVAVFNGTGDFAVGLSEGFKVDVPVVIASMTVLISYFLYFSKPPVNNSPRNGAQNAPQVNAV